MCLAVPARLVEMDAAGQQAVADLHGNRVRISTLLVPEARLHDWVLIHAGFAIRRLDEQEAAATWEVLADLNAAAESPGSANAADAGGGA